MRYNRIYFILIEISTSIDEYVICFYKNVCKVSCYELKIVDKIFAKYNNKQSSERLCEISWSNLEGISSVAFY